MEADGWETGGVRTIGELRAGELAAEVLEAFPGQAWGEMSLGEFLMMRAQAQRVIAKRRRREMGAALGPLLPYMEKDGERKRILAQVMEGFE